MALVSVVALMAATIFATWWMARQQDALADATSRRMVEGGIETFVERAKATLLDYAIWDDSYSNIRANDVDWMLTNIAASTEIGTFDLVLVVPPGGRPIGWRGGRELAAGFVDPATMAAAVRLIDAVPLDSGSAETAFVMLRGAPWLLAVARVVPQDGLPAAISDAELPRLIIAYEITEAFLGRIARRFAIENLAVAVGPPPGADTSAVTLALRGLDGQPLSYLSWTAPDPGGAVLRAALWPLIGLMAAVGAIVLLVSRELVRSARRLEGALARAHAADRAKTAFLSNVSHELRTPLGGIIGVGQLMQMHELDAEMRQMVDILLASARSQLQLVNGLLDITQIESGAMTLARAPFDPSVVLEETVCLMTPVVAERRLMLDVRIADSVRRMVVGDMHAFRQIATNLIGNAMRFTDRGGITVALSTDAAGRVVLVVADTGIGIDPKNHHRIFERFVQVEGSVAHGGGTGLGLAITRALVELEGGTIGVESRLGHGATFTVVLPLPAAEAMASAA